MSRELTLTGALLFVKNDFNPIDLSVVGLAVNVAADNAVYEPGFATSTVDTAIPLGGLTSPFGWAFFKNLDATNTISLKTGVAGTVIISLLPGEFALLRLGSGITAPSCVASAGTPKLKYCVLLP